jgi:hypothetical protein
MAQRSDTAANWTSNNPTLADGEIGIESDTRKYKFGDGTSAWNSLAYSGPVGVTANHNDLAGLQGGSASNKYHSDQEINSTSDVNFKLIGSGDPITSANHANISASAIGYVMSGTISTSGSSRTVTISGGDFSEVEEGDVIIANSETRMVGYIVDSTTLVLTTAVDWTGGYSWIRQGISRIQVTRDSVAGPSTAFSHVTGGVVTWENYSWQDNDKFIFPFWNNRAYKDALTVHENGKFGFNSPYDPITETTTEPTSTVAIYSQPFDYVTHSDGAGTWTDDTADAQISDGTPYLVLGSTDHEFYVGKNAQFRSIFFELASGITGGNVKAYYWGGSSWVEITSILHNKVDTTSNLSVSGYIGWDINTVEGSWLTTSVDVSDSMYFIKIITTALGSGTVTAYHNSPFKGNRLNVFQNPADISGVFAVSQEGHVACGHDVPAVALHVKGEARLAGMTSGYFQLNPPASGPSIELSTPSAAPTSEGQALVYDGSSALKFKAVHFNYGTGEDGDVTISADTTLTSSKFYNNLTIDTGFTLTTANYRIRVLGTLTNNGTLKSGGGNGGNSNGSGGGAAGSSAGSTEFGGGSAGSLGGVGVVGVGALSAAVAALSPRMGGSGGPGGAGGSGGSGAGGAVRVPGNSSYNKVLSLDHLLYAGTLIRGGQGGSGGSSGAGDGANLGRGGGGGGGGGGTVWVAAKNIINVGSISVNGGIGGNGGPTATGNVGGGGGGGGGAGGVVILIYDTYTGAGTVTAVGGTGGNGSSGAGTGTSGDNGTDGYPGTVLKYNCTKGVWE